MEVRVDGDGSQIEVEESRFQAVEFIGLVALGKSVEIEIEESEFESKFTELRVDGRRADLEVDESEFTGDSIEIRADGKRADVEVEESDFEEAGKVEIVAEGRAEVEDNEFGAAEVFVSGGRRCKVDDNEPRVRCQ